jgi:nucleoside-diphosphate-sugar epimerase
MPRLFCFGFGYSAEALAIRLTAAGYDIAGTCRSEARRKELQAMGIEAYLFDRGRPLENAAAALKGTTHLLSSVPPDAAGDAVLDQHAADIAGLRLAWAGYLSTTGVYGDRQGGWVDENTSLAPTTERGRRRVAAEAAWQQLALPLHRFRLAGIYGPGRSQIDTVRAGTAQRIDKPGQVFSRIHVDDIATVLAASIAMPNPGAAYNVCDDEPAPPSDVVAYACQLLKLPPPPLVPFAEAQLSEMGRSFFAESKRVGNRRIKAELGVELRYPNYREGLAALAALV